MGFFNPLVTANNCFCAYYFRAYYDFCGSKRRKMKKEKQGAK
jgi:hypothetical protein